MVGYTPSCGIGFFAFWVDVAASLLGCLNSPLRVTEDTLRFLWSLFGMPLIFMNGEAMHGPHVAKG